MSLGFTGFAEVRAFNADRGGACVFELSAPLLLGDGVPLGRFPGRSVVIWVVRLRVDDDPFASAVCDGGILRITLS